MACGVEGMKYGRAAHESYPLGRSVSMALSDMLAKINKVVKRDDIRGVFGKTITCELAYNLGRALADTFLDCTEVNPVNVVVGHDMRLSGAALA